MIRAYIPLILSALRWRRCHYWHFACTAADQYQVASLGQEVHAVSYLSSSGYTLTVVLDYRTKRLVAFASNEKSLTMQHGTFEPLGSAPR